ncbi:MAG: hypothetical protein M3R36_13355 [Bacteroidota bacterium]|nr:hypothetical protein [Bacteroidota bacterium]
MFLNKAANGYYYLFFNCETTQKRKKISCKTKFKNEALKYLSNFKNQSKQTRQEKSFQIFYTTDLQNEVLKYVSDNLRHGTLLLYKNAFKDLLRITGNKPIKLISISDIENFKSIRLKEVLTLNEIKVNKEGLYNSLFYLGKVSNYHCL